MESDGAEDLQLSSGEPALEGGLELDSAFGESLLSVSINDLSWNSMIVSSLATNLHAVSTLTYPWECGVMSNIFSDGILPSLPSAVPLTADSFIGALAVDSHEPAIEAALEPPISKHYTKIIKNIPDASYHEEKAAKLELGCSRWLAVLQQCSLASDVGVVLLKDFRSDPTGVAAERTLRAVFGVKSPNTMLKRVRTFSRYCKWVKQNYNVIPMPIVEEHTWSFLKYLEDNNFGKTAGADLVECLRFTKFVFGMKGVDDVLQSRRVLGLAAILKSAKGLSAIPCM